MFLLKKTLYYILKKILSFISNFNVSLYFRIFYIRWTEMSELVRRLTADQRVRGSNPSHAGRLGPRLIHALKGYLTIDSEN